MLLDACSVLASGDASIEVRSVYCSLTCPDGLAMLCANKGSLEPVEARCGTPEDAIASAEAAIADAGSVVPSESLKLAFVAQLQAKAAEGKGDLNTARDHYNNLLSLVPAHLLAPCQEPLPAETVEWPGSQWKESLYNSVLSIDARSPDAGELGMALGGTCGGGQALVEKKVVSLPSVRLVNIAADGQRLSGRWEDSAGGAGDFDVSMRPDGRRFAGVLRGGEEGDRPWSGLRKAAAPSGRGATRGRGGRGGRGRGGRGGPGRGGVALRAQPPPSRASWVHEGYLGRSRCHLKLGDAGAAVADARAATELCCRAVSGWSALAEALAAEGADNAAEARAREELEYLKSMP